MNNTVILVGRLTKDIELRYTTSGIAVCNFTLAVQNTYKNKKTGEYEAEFLDIEVWKNIAENLSQYCRQGDMIGVKGSLAKKSYKDKDGKTRYQTYVKAENVMFLSTKKEEKQEKTNLAITKEDPFAEFGQEIEKGTADDLPF